MMTWFRQNIYDYVDDITNYILMIEYRPYLQQANMQEHTFNYTIETVSNEQQYENFLVS